MTTKKQLFLDHYFGKAERNATHAARLAKYADPVKAGPRLKHQLRDLIATKELELADKAIALGRETHELITQIARSSDVNVSARLKALELLAKVNGLTSDKVSLSVDRAGLEAELSTALRQLANDVPNVSLPHSGLSTSKES